jgi:cbb3-type cytochrome oxidase maturation protein
MITASLLVALGFLAAFIWSVKSGQFDDDYTPSVRMLFEENTSSKNKTQNTNSLIKEKINPSVCNSKNSTTTIKS